MSRKSSIVINCSKQHNSLISSFLWENQITINFFSLYFGQNCIINFSFILHITVSLNKDSAIISSFQSQYLLIILINLDIFMILS